MEASSIGCCIWMDFGEQGPVPASQSSWVQRDLSSGALHVSLHLPPLVPTRIKQGWWTDCNYQTGVWPRAMLQYSTKVETGCTPRSSLPTGTNEAAASLPWVERGHIRQNVLATGQWVCQWVLCPSWLWTTALLSLGHQLGDTNRDLVKLS